MLNGEYATRTQAFGGVEFPDQISGGIGYGLQVASRVDWITEVVGHHYTKTDVVEYKDWTDLSSGVRIWLGTPQDWALSVALRQNLERLNEFREHPLRGLVGLSYFPHRVSGSSRRRPATAASSAAATPATATAAASPATAAAATGTGAEA